MKILPVVKSFIVVHLFYGSTVGLNKTSIIEIKKDLCSTHADENNGFIGKDKLNPCIKIITDDENIYFVKDSMKYINENMGK